MKIRDYRDGRRDYGLGAADAIEYARNRALADAALWTAEPDEYPCEGLVVVLYDDDEQQVDALGGVDVDFTVSDHGNTIYDEHDPYLVHVVAEIIRNQQEAA